MSPTVKHQVEAYQHTCNRCSHSWWTFTETPSSCAKCKSRYWNEERTRALYPSPGAIRQRAWRKRTKAAAKAAKRAAKAAKSCRWCDTGQPCIYHPLGSEK